MRLIEMKRQVNNEMSRLVFSAVVLSFLLYLLGVGAGEDIPIWGALLVQTPGAVIFISLLGAYSLVLATMSFFNHQTYDALIDQFILKVSSDGVLDVDVVKAGFEKEWLIFKLLRSDFSHYNDVHIKVRRTQALFSRIIFLSATFVIMFPFFGVVLSHPVLSLVMLPDTWMGVVAKSFSVLSSLTCVLMILLSLIGFNCDVELNGEMPVES